VVGALEEGRLEVRPRVELRQVEAAGHPRPEEQDGRDRPGGREGDPDRGPR
jgi:hypothetical protein